jgi:hypothetical protein
MIDFALGSYLDTAIALVARGPRRFFIAEGTSDRMPPLTFLVTSVTVTAFAVTGLLSLVGWQLTDADKWQTVAEAMALLVGQTVLTLVAAAIIAKLHRDKDFVTDAVAAYCYTSWTFIVLGAATALMFAPIFDGTAFVVMACVAAAPYNVYVLHSISAALGRIGKRSARFVAYGLFVVAALYTLCAALLPQLGACIECLRCDQGIIRGAKFVSWNSHPRDHELLRVSDSLHGGWFTEAEVKAGTVVSFLLYINNSSTADAHHVRAHLFFDGTVSGTTTVRAVVTSGDGAKNAEGSVRLYSAQAVRCEYSSGSSYEGNEKESRPLPFSQTGQEVLTTGLLIGNLEPGWRHTRNIVAQFHCTQ